MPTAADWAAGTALPSVHDGDGACTRAPGMSHPHEPMTLALSDSYCERCGTRAAIEVMRPKSGAMAGVRVLGKGLRKLALTRAASLDEAMATARLEEERAANDRELEELNGAFHFCLACRRYTCPACWNPGGGGCLTCRPDPALTAEIGRAHV